MKKHTEYMRRYAKRKPWSNIYYKAKSRCNNHNCNAYKWYGLKGIKFNLTMEQVKKLWERDALGLKRPSLDRINNKGNYDYKNCRFIELTENSCRNNSKKIVQRKLDGELVKVWKSQSDASRSGFIQSEISKCCKGLRKTHHKFMWEFYKEEA